MTSYKIDEVGAAARNLNDLLDVICELQFESGNGSSADRRLDSLLWIARDLSEGIVAKHEEDKNEDLVSLGDQLLALNAKFQRCKAGLMETVE